MTKYEMALCILGLWEVLPQVARKEGVNEFSMFKGSKANMLYDSDLFKKTCTIQIKMKSGETFIVEVKRQ